VKKPERPHITDLLATHRRLLDRHLDRIRDLMAIAVDRDHEATEMSFIVADLAGHFGAACLEESAAVEFVVFGGGPPPTIVMPIGVDGLVAILREVVPEAVGPVLTRPPGTIAIFICDGQDEPAIVLMPISELMPAPCS
jgi:hypothetical protein